MTTTSSPTRPRSAAATSAVLTRTAAPIVAVFTVAGILIGLVVGLIAIAALAGFVMGLILAAAWLTPAWRQAEARVLATLRQQWPIAPADPATHARLCNLVDGLCSAAGIVRPRLFVANVALPNAIAFGRMSRGHLVVTTGLLTTLDRVQLEGVVARELLVLHSGTSAGATVAASIGASPLRPLVRRAVEAPADVRDEVSDDLAAVSLTRYPPGLLLALEKVGDGIAGATPSSGVPPSLWLAAPGADVAARIDERVDLLREL